MLDDENLAPPPGELTENHRLYLSLFLSVFPINGPIKHPSAACNLLLRSELNAKKNRGNDGGTETKKKEKENRVCRCESI